MHLINPIIYMFLQPILKHHIINPTLLLPLPPLTGNDPIPNPILPNPHNHDLPLHLVNVPPQGLRDIGLGPYSFIHNTKHLQVIDVEGLGEFFEVGAWQARRGVEHEVYEAQQ
jgi:hypothetical protein